MLSLWWRLTSEREKAFVFNYIITIIYTLKVVINTKIVSYKCLLEMSIGSNEVIL